MNFTSHQLNSLRNSMLLQEHSEDGQKKVKLDICVPQLPTLNAVNESTTSKMSNASLEYKTKHSPLEPQCVTHVSVQDTKKKTSKDKLIHSKHSSQTVKSSKMSDQDLTGIDLDSSPFWNSYTQELSNKLWLPGKTDCVVSDLNLLNGSLKKQMLSSWFSVQMMELKTPLKNFQMTSLQSLLCSSQETTDSGQVKTSVSDKESQKKPPAEKARRIRVYPNSEQKRTLSNWFGVRRWIYNKCLECIKNGTCKPALKELRENVINNKNFQKENSWMLNYEYDLRDEALRDFLKNIKSNFSKGRSFNMKFLNKKTSQSLSVLSKKWNKKNNFYSSVFKPNILHSAEPLPNALSYSSRLLCTPTKKYYLCLPQSLEKSENQARTFKAIFIDPGVKNFVTGYDPEGKIVVWGQKNIGKIARLLHYKRIVQSKEASVNAKKRKRLKLAELRINERIRNLVDDLHKKCAKWLCENYTHIYIPKLNFHKCKGLRASCKSKLASLRHCAFVDRLINKCREFANRKVFVVGESYTSKTCGRCGWQNDTLKNKDVFTCDHCKLVIERDINASRNIMLRFLSKRAEAYSL